MSTINHSCIPSAIAVAATAVLAITIGIGIESPASATSADGRRLATTTMRKAKRKWRRANTPNNGNTTINRGPSIEEELGALSQSADSAPQESDHAGTGKSSSDSHRRSSPESSESSDPNSEISDSKLSDGRNSGGDGVKRHNLAPNPLGCLAPLTLGSKISSAAGRVMKFRDSAYQGPGGPCKELRDHDNAEDSELEEDSQESQSQSSGSERNPNSSKSQSKYTEGGTARGPGMSNSQSDYESDQNSQANEENYYDELRGNYGGAFNAMPRLPAYNYGVIPGYNQGVIPPIPAYNQGMPVVSGQENLLHTFTMGAGFFQNGDMLGQAYVNYGQINFDEIVGSGVNHNVNIQGNCDQQRGGKEQKEQKKKAKAQKTDGEERDSILDDSRGSYGRESDDESQSGSIDRSGSGSGSRSPTYTIGGTARASSEVDANEGSDERISRYGSSDDRPSSSSKNIGGLSYQYIQSDSRRGNVEENDHENDKQDVGEQPKPTMAARAKNKDDNPLQNTKLEASVQARGSHLLIIPSIYERGPKLLPSGTSREPPSGTSKETQPESEQKGKEPKYKLNISMSLQSAVAREKRKD